MPRLETLRAKAGAVLLDIFDPGWAEKIDTDRLDLSDCRRCILGQRFGRYDAGAEKLFAMQSTDDKRQEAAERAGFYLSPKVDHVFMYDDLTKAWKREIAKRLE